MGKRSVMMARDGADDSAEEAGDDTGEEEQPVAGDDAAEKGAEDETAVEAEEQPLAVETVGEAGRHDARDAGADGVGGDHQAELGRGDPHLRHEDGPQGGEDHEVDDDGELEQRKKGDDELLVGGEGGREQSHYGTGHPVSNPSG
jgi:hypothetical protein